MKNKCEPKAYWANTSGNQVIGQVMARADQGMLVRLTDLLGGETIWSPLDENMVYPDIDVAEDADLDAAVCTLLLMAGYLTVGDQDPPEDQDGLWPLVIPYHELDLVYRRQILQRLATPFRAEWREAAWKALRSGDPDALQLALGALLRSASYFDLSDEGDYHMWLLGLLACMPGYRQLSNREPGDGRYDIMFLPQMRSLPGILLELKKEKDCSEDAPEKLAMAAIGQVHEKNYVDELEANDVRDALVFGVAFAGKTLKVVSETVRLKE